jgi:arylsulfatase A-like enzyme
VLRFVFFRLLFVLPSLAARAEEKPNIILIYSDDHDWAEMGAQGADRHLRPPHRNAMAGEGVRFSRGYVTAPQCVPSQAGILAGRYQQRFGVEDNHKGPLPLAQITLAERLKAAGYVTDQVGKLASGPHWLRKLAQEERQEA